ncbi:MULTISPECIES: hypothetical protein [unclassified Mycobacterium]|uniref:hypothetical protein n=1 Tax=unclassified Mycobacterium TaxID=2642494 RepID=UPI0029C6091C|nr:MULTISPECIES: hypothetical protein [unclassified Mycobacterium]
MNARRIAACVLAAGALLTGCQSTVPGEPQPNAGNPTEPSFSTPRPSRSSQTPTPTSKPSSPTKAPTPGEALPSENGWSFIETKSGKTRCQLSQEEVGCEAPFTNAPMIDGIQANGIRLTADGEQEWLVGNLGDPPVVSLDYRTYTAQGWTIEAAEAGTKFTNDATGHGMFVTIEKVDFF